MKEIIEAIKKDTTFNQEVLDDKIKQALQGNPKIIALQDSYPKVLVQLQDKLEQGYTLEPMHNLNIQRQGFCSFALHKPEHILKEEADQIISQTKENYTASLIRLRDRLIADAVETALEDERAKEIALLHAKETAAKEKIKAKLMAGLS